MSMVGGLERVQTARLAGERLRPDHLPAMIALMSDPRVSRTIWPEKDPVTEAHVQAWLERVSAHWERHGFGQWVLVDRASGVVVGRGGLQHTHVAGRDEVEVGWAVMPERWGEGLATELALRSVEVAFDDLGLTQIVAFSLPTNTASRRVMEKAGFSFEADIEHAGLPHVLYRLRAADGASRAP